MLFAGCIIKKIIMIIGIIKLLVIKIIIILVKTIEYLHRVQIADKEPHTLLNSGIEWAKLVHEMPDSYRLS